MLAVNKYPQAHVDACKARVKQQLTAWRKLAAATPDAKALAAFEPTFFNNMVLVLDGCFMHRTRGLEGKDGNPANEVRLLCGSLLENGGVFRGEKAIKFVPEASVLKLREGDAIALTEAGFTALAKAYFAEIERRFV